MKMQRILILGVAAWLGSMVYKVMYVAPDVDSNGAPESGSHQGHSFYSAVNGPGSLGATVRHSSDARTASLNQQEPTPGTIPITGYNNRGPLISQEKPGSKRRGTTSGAVEDLAPSDLGLLQAASKGDKSTLERRLAARAKVDSRDAERRTPLMFASWNGYNDIIDRLLAAGANPDLQDRDGNNAFDYAASRGLVDTLKFLLARTHMEDNNHYMEYAQVMQATFAGDPARLPPGNGKLASINHITPESQAPLQIAAGNGSVALMQAMIRRGADVNIASNGKQTPLHWAAWNNQPQAAKLLLDSGANLKMTDSGGNTPLILAAQNHATDVVKVLLEHGADKYAANKSGKTAAIIAEDNGFSDITALLQ